VPILATTIPSHSQKNARCRNGANGEAETSSRGGPRTWFEGYDPAAGYYWPRLREWLLLDKGRTESGIDAIDTATDKILSMLGDPRPGGSPFQARGLVVGYVQSGKTANFTALIAKAYDAGYRIVIVMSGLHNSLRRQTQLRLEDELGLVPAGPQRRAVAQPEPGREIVRMTGAEIWQDFHPGTADPSLLQRAFRRACRERRTEPIIPQRSTTGIKGLGKLRYVVEQTIGLLHQFRRLAVRWERRPDIHNGFVSLACALISWRRLINWAAQRSC
jgi:hypothetical protein